MDGQEMAGAEKRCSRCRRSLSTDRFSHDQNRADGLFPQCKDCRREYREAHREDILAYNRSYQDAHHDQLLMRWRRYRDGNRDALRSRDRARKERDRDTINARARERYAADPAPKRGRARAAYWKDPAEALRRTAMSYNKHAAVRRASARERYWARPELYRQKRRDWHHINRAAANASSRGYKRANASLIRELNRARRNRKLQAEGSHTDAEWDALCALHGYRCLRCGERRPLTEDHIVPLTKGGSDYITNIQPLCTRCNSIKGRRIIDYRPTPAQAAV